MTKFLLDSGDPEEYKQIFDLAKKNGSEIWGATTNPSLIAKKLAGRKVTPKEAFELQKQIVLEIIDIVPGAVSAEVYADENTKASEMIEQARQITSWYQRIIVKLPTTIEGFKARTQLREQKIPINNTLVFSQQQIFAICLHEQLIQNERRPKNRELAQRWPPFISPFVGRLDDQGEDGMALVENGMRIKRLFEGVPTGTPWLLEASVRRVEHLKRGLLAQVEIITAPAKVLQEWFTLSKEKKEALEPLSYAQNLTKEEYWQPSQELLSINSIDEFMEAIETGKLNIHHELTDKGVVRFAQDWKSLLQG